MYSNLSMSTKNTDKLDIAEQKGMTETHPSWTMIYHVVDCILKTDVDIYTQNQKSDENDDSDVKIFFNFRFGSYLRKLEKEAIIIQYQLACLSTLGGAYHLCNKPRVALAISIRQEMIGRRLGSTLLIIRAKVFQAVNLWLLGHSHESNKAFSYCYYLLDLNPWLEDSRNFVEASKLWLENNHSNNLS